MCQDIRQFWVFHVFSLNVLSFLRVCTRVARGSHKKGCPFTVVLRYASYIIDQIDYIFHRDIINMMPYLLAIGTIVVNLQVGDIGERRGGNIGRGVATARQSSPLHCGTVPIDMPQCSGELCLAAATPSPRPPRLGVPQFQAISSALSCLGLFTRRETGRAVISSVG